MNQPTIFTLIIRGEIPSHKIYEDERTYAFLNIYPSRPGHTLVIPKAQVDRLEDLETEDYAAVMATTQRVMQHLREVMGTARACLKVEGFAVPHAHVHVIPCDTPEDFLATDSSEEADHSELDALAQRLAF